MANTSISNLPTASETSLTDLLPATQGATLANGGITRKLTLQQVLNALTQLALPSGDAQPGDTALISRNGGVYAASPSALVTAGGGAVAAAMIAGDSANAAAAAAAQATANAALSASAVNGTSIQAALGYSPANASELTTTTEIATAAQTTAANAITVAQTAAPLVGGVVPLTNLPSVTVQAGSQGQGLILAGPVSGSGTASWRSLQTSDVNGLGNAASRNVGVAVGTVADGGAVAAGDAANAAAASAAQFAATAAQATATQASGAASTASTTAVAAQAVASTALSTAQAALPTAGGAMSGTLKFAVNPVSNGGTTAMPNGYTAGDYSSQAWAVLGAPLVRINRNNNSAAVVSVVQSNPYTGSGTQRFPAGLNAYSLLSGAGNQAFGFYARSDLAVPGGTQVEFDSNNFAGPPDINVPPNFSFGTTTNAPRGLILDAIGPYACTAAYGTGYNSLNTWLRGFYTRVGSNAGSASVQNEGVFIDASLNAGTQYPLFVRSPFQALTPSATGNATVLALTTTTAMGTTVVTLDNPTGATLFGTVTDGVVVTVNATSGLSTGQMVTGSGIASGTTIAQIVDAQTLILSLPITAAISAGASLTIGGSTTITTSAATPMAVIAPNTVIGNVEPANVLFLQGGLSSAIKVGVAVSGDSRIPSQTTVTHTDPNGYVILSAPCTGTIPAGTQLTIGTVTVILAQPTATYVSLLNYFPGNLVPNLGGTTIYAPTANLAVGQSITDAGDTPTAIAAGTTISAILDSNTLTISAPLKSAISSGIVLTVNGSITVTATGYTPGPTDSGPVLGNIASGTKVAVSSRPYWFGARFLAATYLQTGDGITTPDNSQSPVIQIETQDLNHMKPVYQASLRLDGTFDNNAITLAGQISSITGKLGSTLTLATRHGTQLELLDTTNTATNYVTLKGASGSTAVSIGASGTGATTLGLQFQSLQSSTVTTEAGVNGGLYVGAVSGKGTGTLNLAGAIYVTGTPVVGARQTGWTAGTGATPNKGTINYSTVTLAQLAARVMALEQALFASTGHGLIGP